MRLELLGLATLLFSLALLLVALLRLPLRHVAGAQAQYGLWLLVPAVLIAAAVAALQPQRPLRWQIELPEQAFSLAEPVHRASPLAEAPQPVEPIAATLLLGLWLFGAAGCVAIWSLAHRRLLRQRRLPTGASAALVGAWKPRLRLPVDFRQRFPASERRLILLHERLHAERGDTRWLLLALGLVAAQWFNPLAWWALRRLRADMEQACDAALLRRHPDCLKAYRQALLRAEDLGLPVTVSPCSSHPLIERIQMLPSHTRPATRRWISLVLVSLSASLAYAAQPTRPPAAAPASVAGYSKLRLDIAVSVNGQAQAPLLLLQTFNENPVQRLSLPDGQTLLMSVSGRPHRDESMPAAADLLMLEFRLIDAATGAPVAAPRLITKDGVAARIEFGQQGERIIRIDTLPRVVQTRLHDSRGALAELLRDIEAGKAPGSYNPLN